MFGIFILSVIDCEQIFLKIGFEEKYSQIQFEQTYIYSFFYTSV